MFNYLILLLLFLFARTSALDSDFYKVTLSPRLLRYRVIGLYLFFFNRGGSGQNDHYSSQKKLHYIQHIHHI